MDDLHRVGRLADGAWAFSGLSNLATVNIDADCMLTHGALEESYKGQH
jgi:hypothetical protein